MKIKLTTLLVLLSTNALAYDNYGYGNNSYTTSIEERLSDQYQNQSLQNEVNREILRSLQNQNNNYYGY